MKKNGFTLVELLAVIVILGIILIVAVPKIITTIDNAKLSTLEDTTKMIAVQAEKEYVTRTTLDTLDQVGDPITCEDIVNLSSNDYANCEISFIGDTAYVSIDGIGNFDGYSCINGTKTEPNCQLILYQDESGANSPILYDNMIPVKYVSNNWIYADATEEWYDYDSKEWANAVVLIASPSKTYSVGDTISMNDIAMMYVWIPRFKYTIFNINDGSPVSPSQINLSFETGSSTTGTMSCSDAICTNCVESETCTDTTNSGVKKNISTYTHPAFTFGNTQLTGFWIGKFEMGIDTNNSCYTTPNTTNCNVLTLDSYTKPDLKPWRYATVSTFFNKINSISTDFSINANTHMIKNMEWGAVAYLTQSIYGRCASGTCTEVFTNPNNTFLTGQAGTSVSAPGTSTTYTYNDSIYGIYASTTGNVYGVYDMSGGTYEYSMGNMVDSSGNFYPISSGFASAPDSKYYDKYSYSQDFDDSAFNRGKYGDATEETITFNMFSLTITGWNDDYCDFPSYTTASWFTRGGQYNSWSQSGVFAYGESGGSASAYYTTRMVISNY